MVPLQILTAARLLLLAALVFPLLLAAWLLVVRLRVALCLRAGRRRKVLGLLHPYANDGGGGERVLWVALRELVERRRVLDWRVVVYTGDRVTPEQIRAHAARQFGIVVPAEVEFVYLRTRFAVEPGLYPVATLLGQALGSLLLVSEVIFRAPPSVLLDTSGYGYSYALAKALGVPKASPAERAPRPRHCPRAARPLPPPLQIGCYVHYPMITSEMCARVASGVAAHNNKRAIGRSALLTKLKLYYYDGLMRAYCFSGRQADAVLANGSWTAAHLQRLWRDSDAQPSLDMSNSLASARTCRTDGEASVSISPPPLPGAEPQYASLSSLASGRCVWHRRILTTHCATKTPPTECSRPLSVRVVCSLLHSAQPEPNQRTVRRGYMGNNDICIPNASSQGPHSTYSGPNRTELNLRKLKRVPFPYFCASLLSHAGLLARRGPSCAPPPTPRAPPPPPPTPPLSRSYRCRRRRPVCGPGCGPGYPRCGRCCAPRPPPPSSHSAPRATALKPSFPKAPSRGSCRRNGSAWLAWARW